VEGGGGGLTVSGVSWNRGDFVKCVAIQRRLGIPALGHVLKKRYISQSIKVRLYKTVIRPIVTYGAETWTLTEKMGKLLMTWERKFLRKIYGPTKENGCWRVKINHEI
jgi:hypothetical protein